MKGLWLLSLFTLAGGGLLGLGVIEDPGFVLVSWDGYVLQCSFWTGLTLAVLFYGLTYLLLHLLLKLIHLPDWLSHWSSQRQMSRSQHWLTQGFVALQLESWAKAETFFLRAARHAPFPFPALQGAILAAEKQQATERLQSYLTQAESAAPGDVVGLLRVRTLLNAQHPEEALIQLQRLHQLYPQNVVILNLLLDLLTQQQRWTALSERLPCISQKMRNRHTGLQHTELQAYAGLIQHLAQQATTINAPQVTESIAAYTRQLPRSVRNQPELKLAEARALLHLHQDEAAAALLLPLLKNRHIPEAAIELSGLLQLNLPDTLISLLQTLQQKQPDNPALLRALGRLHRHAGHWRSAQDLFEASLALHKDPSTLVELIELLKTQHQEAEALYLLKQFLHDFPSSSGKSSEPVLNSCRP